MIIQYTINDNNGGEHFKCILHNYNLFETWKLERSHQKDQLKYFHASFY